MTSWPPDAETDLLAELAKALGEPERVPVDFLSAARAAFTWRTIDAELALAELTFDSACDAEPAGLTRSGAAVRTLTFTGGNLLVEIEVSGSGVVGQLTPSGDGGLVTAGTADGVYEQVAVDPMGFFTLGAPPAGPVRLCARTVRGTVATSWVSLA